MHCCEGELEALIVSSQLCRLLTNGSDKCSRFLPCHGTALCAHGQRCTGGVWESRPMGKKIANHLCPVISGHGCAAVVFTSLEPCPHFMTH